MNHRFHAFERQSLCRSRHLLFLLVHGLSDHLGLLHSTGRGGGLGRGALRGTEATYQSRYRLFGPVLVFVVGAGLFGAVLVAFAAALVVGHVVVLGLGAAFSETLVQLLKDPLASDQLEDGGQVGPHPVLLL